MAQLKLRPTSELRVFIIARALNWEFTVLALEKLYCAIFAYMHKENHVFVKIMPIIVRPFLLSSIFPFRDQQRFAFYDIWIGYMGYKILKKSFKSSQKAYPTFFVLLNLWAVEDVDWLKEGKSAAALCFDFKIRLNNWLAHQMKFYPVLGAFFCKCWQFNMAFK